MKIHIFAAMLIAMLAAVSYASVSVTPEIQNVKIKKAKKTECSIEVKNNSSFPMSVHVEPEEWSRGNKVKISAGSWLDVKPKEFTLKPGRTRRIKVTAMANTIIDKERFTQIFFACKDSKNGNSNGLNIGIRIASLICWSNSKK